MNDEATSTAPTTEPLLTREEFLALESIDALVALYGERGLVGDPETVKTREQLVELVTTRAQLDWFRVAFEYAKTITEEPETFLPDEVERGGVTFRVFGLFHGNIGGGDKAYKTWVKATLRAQDQVLFENALGYFYPAKSKVGIPDLLVNGAVGSVVMGFDVGSRFPLHVAESLSELFNLRRRPAEDALESFEFSPRYHAVDAETRRGLEPYPPLPSRLEVEYWMKKWDEAGWLGPWVCPGAIVPRSMFMAGFAVGYAESRSLTSVALVVGDLHTMEIVRFLEQPDVDQHPVFQDGRRWGRRSGLTRITLGWALKLVFLTLAGGIGAVLFGLQIAVVVAVLFGIWSLTQPG